MHLAASIALIPRYRVKDRSVRLVCIPCSVFVRDACGPMLEPFSMVVTDGAGRRGYSGVAPGEVTVSARGGPLTCEESEAVSVNEDRQTAITLRLEPGRILLVVLRDKQGILNTASDALPPIFGR
jgi:hypothetical protein